MLSLVTRVPVSGSIESVTTIATDREVDPRSVGLDGAGIDAIWRAVESLYAAGVHPAMQLCIRRRGKVVIDRAIGYAKGGGPHDPADGQRTLATPDTPFNVFSASKAVTAMLIHLLDQQHLLHLDDPVCEYIPEFAMHGKRWITIRHVLTHRAGVPNIPPEAMRLDLLNEPAEILRMLCAARPVSRAGRRLAYHAISGGFLLGEIVRRVTGDDIRTVLACEILERLGFRWMNYGVAPEDVDRVASNHFTGLPVLPPVSWIFRRFLGVEFERVPELGNDPRYLTAIVPSGNVIATANELSRFYQLLLNGGELDGVRIFEPRTIRRAVSEQSYLEFDFSLAMPVRYGMGFMLGSRWMSFWGPDTFHAFGHIGFITVLGWADPERQITVALMTSGKPLLYPEIGRFAAISREISRVCPKEPGFDWWDALSRDERERSAMPRKSV
ncbi:MAG: beta-lactamase family protein [Deltaproteobacteria bacterium]|nr:beta-lactamase family protein [Deltaproteobacteria bacterium]